MQTVEGEAVWELIKRTTTQIRVTGNGLVMGFDMAAVLAMAASLGIERFVVANMLPGIEAAMARKMNEQIAQGRSANTLDGDV